MHVISSCINNSTSCKRYVPYSIDMPVTRSLNKLYIHRPVGQISTRLVALAILLALDLLQWTSRITFRQLVRPYSLQGYCRSSSNPQNEPSDARVILLRCIPEDKRKHNLPVGATCKPISEPSCKRPASPALNGLIKREDSLTCTFISSFSSLFSLLGLPAHQS